MQLRLIQIALGLTFAGISCAFPTEDYSLKTLLGRALTPDNTCGNVANGNNKGYTCDPNISNGGGCCSGSGYCGKTSDYCGTGCQAAFGTCTSSIATTTTPTSIPTSTPTSTPGPKPVLTPDNTCGNVLNGNNKNYTCDPTRANGGGCCSTSGYCGTTIDYCGTGCQAAFGVCSGSDATVIDPNLCGPTHGNNKCLSGLCCSGNGYCGNSTDYCSTPGCQSNFGVCTATTVGSGSVTCGPAFGNAICASGLCCSPSGYCGTGSDYCSDPYCLYNFGTCDSDTTPAGASTLTDPRPLLGSVSYDQDIIDCVQKNVVALTYDDGPYLYTGQLLDILKLYGFHATFFMTGNNNAKGAIDTTAPYPSIIQRMIAEGHQVASHTWSHYSLSSITSTMRKDQMAKNERAIANIIGKYPTYMRPPYSQCDAASGCQADMKALGYHRVYFDLDTQDYLNPSPLQIGNSKAIVSSILAQPGASDWLSIQHDIVQQSVTNLTSYYFDLIKAKGWKGVTAGECLGDPEANWYRTPGTGSTTTSSTSKSSSTLSSSSTSTTSLIPVTTSSTTTTPTISSTTTSSTTSRVPTGTTSPTATSNPRAAPTCVVQHGEFCGSIVSFADKASCQKSAADCYVQSGNCAQQAGKRGKAACNTYNNDCKKLNTFCASCGTNCESTNFHPWLGSD